MTIVNLGCGDDTYGDIRVDIRKTKTTTDVFDVEKGLPFEKNSIDKVYSKNLLEHLRNPGYHISECYRVLKRGGILDIITDNAECIRYYLFGTHTGRYETENPGDQHYEIFTRSHLMNHFTKAGFFDPWIRYVKTDTRGRWFDLLTLYLLGKPRIRMTAKK